MVAQSVADEACLGIFVNRLGRQREPSHCEVQGGQSSHTFFSFSPFHRVRELECREAFSLLTVSAWKAQTRLDFIALSPLASSDTIPANAFWLMPLVSS